MSQQDCLGIRGKWVSNIQEYDLEIKPTKLIKGQGLAKMLTQGNEKTLGIIFQNSGPKQCVSGELQRLEKHPWNINIILFLRRHHCQCFASKELGGTRETYSLYE